MGQGQVAQENVVVRMNPELKQLVCRAAQQTETQSMGEYIVGVLAAHFERDDLQEVPRKRLGRPPADVEKIRTTRNGNARTHARSH